MLEGGQHARVLYEEARRLQEESTVLRAARDQGRWDKQELVATQLQFEKVNGQLNVWSTQCDTLESEATTGVRV